MQHPRHMTAFAPEPARTRIIGFAVVGLLHIVLIWALVSGLAMRIVQNVPQIMEARVISSPQKEQGSIPKLQLVVPKDTLPPPVIEIQAPTENAISVKTAPSAPAAPSASAQGINSTHTTPPYPPDARRLGQQGTVTLHIIIDANGMVTNATVTRSSGFPELDQTAVNWVTAHWRYKPAVQNGVAIPSSSDANVIFSLRNAR